MVSPENNTNVSEQLTERLYAQRAAMDAQFNHFVILGNTLKDVDGMKHSFHGADDAKAVAGIGDLWQPGQSGVRASTDPLCGLARCASRRRSF